MEKSISFNTDTDGFLSQECPACSGRFKTKFGEGSDQPISFCPYCSHMGRDCWWTPEQVEYIGEAGAKFADDEMAKAMAGMARRINSQSGSGLVKIKMTTSPSTRRMPAAPPEPDIDMPIFEFICCNEPIKHDSGVQNLTCVICGKEHSC